MNKHLFASCDQSVKAELINEFASNLDDLWKMAEDEATPVELEKAVVGVAFKQARLMMTYLFGLRCRRATENDIRSRGLNREQVRVRNEPDYDLTVKTVVGEVTFPSFAYRESGSGFAWVGHTPAGKVFPLRKRTMSSQCLLEWETRLGNEFPFRRAEEALKFFTHGQVSVTDNTIADHLVKVGRLVDPAWCYRPVEEIRDILEKRATRDDVTGRPIVYASTDAENLRRYVDETWDAQWKHASGVRLWCQDRRTGELIHLGGQYVWGDLDPTREVFQWLIDTGRLPADGDYGHGVVAQIVMPSDGAPWIKDHIIPLFAKDIVAILDPYHVMPHLAAYAAVRHPGSKKARKRWYSKGVNMLLGDAKLPKRKKAKKRKLSKAERDQRTKQRRKRRAHRVAMPAADAPNQSEVLLNWLREERKTVPECKKKRAEELDRLIKFIESNVHRMDYVRYRARGMKIGSGAMESLHRTTQVRLKLSGMRWLEETSQAIFNIRMLVLVGRWEEFWSQPDLTERLLAAFAAVQREKAEQRKEAA
jgi:hypothetical protein